MLTILWCTALVDNQTWWISKIYSLNMLWYQAKWLVLESLQFYFGGITHARLTQIAQFIGFSIGYLPFNYLGVPINQRKLVTVAWQKVCKPLAQGG
jgi:hypothetical protein